MSLFEEGCKQKEISLYVLPPKSPQKNGGVERMNRTMREGLYNRPNMSADSIGVLRLELKKRPQNIQYVLTSSSPRQPDTTPIYSKHPQRNRVSFNMNAYRHFQFLAVCSCYYLLKFTPAAPLPRCRWWVGSMPQSPWVAIMTMPPSVR